MSTNYYALLIAFLLSFGGLCWLAVMLGIERDAHAVTRADYDTVSAHHVSTHRLNANLLAELTSTQRDRSRIQDERDQLKSHADKLAHAAAHLLVNRFQMPTIDGWHRDDEEPRQALMDPSPVYDRLVRDTQRPRLGVVVSPFDGPKRVPGVDR